MILRLAAFHFSQIFKDYSQSWVTKLVTSPIRIDHSLWVLARAIFIVVVLSVSFDLFRPISNLCLHRKDRFQRAAYQLSCRYCELPLGLRMAGLKWEIMDRRVFWFSGKPFFFLFSKNHKIDSSNIIKLGLCFGFSNKHKMAGNIFWRANTDNFSFGHQVCCIFFPRYQLNFQLLEFLVFFIKCKVSQSVINYANDVIQFVI